MTDFAKLVLDTDTRGLKKGEQDLKSLSRTSTQTAKGITAAVGKITGALAGALAVSGGIGELVRVNAEFGASMQKVAAISGATGAELKALTETAKELGSSTQFSASQAADALGFLAMAGFSAEQAMTALPDVLSLAAAGGLELSRAADIASNVLSGFAMEASEASMVSDVLAAAASSTNTSVEQLGGAMSTAAPIAKSLGISLSETAAAVGALSDAGIQGERAGTALRGVFASLAGPTTQAREALAKYGLTAADVDPQTVGLSNALATLRERGISTADAMVIFGREAASGALVLADASEKVRELTGEFETAEGTAQRMAKTMNDNLGGDIKALSSATEGLIIALGEGGATGSMRTLTQVATMLINQVTNLVSSMENTAAKTEDVIRGIKILSGWVSNITSGIASFASRLGITAERLSWLQDRITRVISPASMLVNLLERIGGAANRRDVIFGSASGALAQIGAELKDFNALNELDKGLGSLANATVPAFTSSIGSMSSSLQGSSTAASSSAKAVDRAANSYDRAADAARRLRTETQRLLDRTLPDSARFSRDIADIGTIMSARRAGLINDNQRAQAGASILSRGTADFNKAASAELDKFNEEFTKSARDAERNGVTIQRTFADLAQSVSGSLQGLTNSIKSGDFLGILGGVLNILTQLGGAGVFGQKIANNINRPVAGARANGGPVTGGQTYLVGERGPELFTAPHSGQIISNDNMRQSGGGQKVVVINNSSFAEVFVDGKIQQAAPAIAQGGANLGNSQMSRKRTRSVR